MLAAAAIPLGVVGCAPPPDSTPVATTTAVVESTTSASPDTVRERCPDPYPGTGGPDCFAESDGYRATKRVRDGHAVVTVQRAGGAVQTITIPIDGFTGSGALLLRRLSAAATPDILVSTTTSGAHGQNSTWSVWHSSGGPFTTIGTLYGREFWDAGSGLVGSYSSGGGWAVTFSTRVAGRFRTVAEVGRSDIAGVRDPAVPECTVVSREAGAPADPCALALSQARAHGLAT